MKEVSTWKIIKNDHRVFLMATGGPILLLFAGFAGAFRIVPSSMGRRWQEVDPQLLLVECIVALIISILLFCMLASRIANLKRILRTGKRTNATITDVNFYRARGRVDFQYTCDGQNHHASVAVMKNSQTTALACGAQIEVAVDPECPATAAIVLLYCCL